MEYVTQLGCLTLPANVLLVMEARDVKKVGDVTSVRQSTDHKASISKLKHFNAVTKKLCPLIWITEVSCIYYCGKKYRRSTYVKSKRFTWIFRIYIKAISRFLFCKSYPKHPVWYHSPKGTFVQSLFIHLSSHMQGIFHTINFPLLCLKPYIRSEHLYREQRISWSQVTGLSRGVSRRSRYQLDHPGGGRSKDFCFF